MAKSFRRIDINQVGATRPAPITPTLATPQPQATPTQTAAPQTAMSGLQAAQGGGGRGGQLSLNLPSQQRQSGGYSGGGYQESPVGEAPKAAVSSPEITKGFELNPATMFDFGGAASANPNLGASSRAMEGLLRFFTRRPSAY